MNEPRRGPLWWPAFALAGVLWAVIAALVLGIVRALR